MAPANALIDVLLTGLDGLALLIVVGLPVRWLGLLVLSLLDWNRQRAHRTPDLAHPVPLTVVVPAYNEARVIRRTVECLLGSQGVEVTVLVVDDGSRDATADEVRQIEDPRVHLLVQEPNQGKARALNRGFGEARTDLVVTVDADTLVEETCLAWLVAAQQRSKAAAVASNVRVGNRRRLLAMLQSLEYVASLHLDRRAQNLLGVITTIPGAAALWRRDVVVEHGGFSPDTLAEDTDLCVTLLRTDQTLVFEARAWAFTEVPSTLGGLWRQRRRWLWGNLACIWKHGWPWSAPWRVRFLALPNLWFAHIGVYLVPVLAALLGWWHRDDLARALIAPWATTLLVIDAVSLIALTLADRSRGRDLIVAPLQRLVWPLLLGTVFVSTWLWPPRSWATIARTGRAERQRRLIPR
ncbi:MAG: glycosyltransferase family 2 protein [Myxococcota bacterium]